MSQNYLLGGLATVLAVFFFGNTYIFVKRFEARDGMFVALAMSMGQVLPSLVVSFCYDFATVHPVAMLSGVFFAIGNSFTVIIIEGLSMAVGGLLWNVTTCLWSWAVAMFGLFGTTAIHAANPILNYVGVGVILAGGFVFTLIRANHVDTRPAPYYSSPDEFVTITAIGKPSIHREKTRRPPSHRRVLALILSIVAGTCYGNIPTSINFIVDRAVNGTIEGYKEVPSSHAAYMLSYSIGALLMSMVIFIGYAIKRRNLPFINVEIAMPALIAGIVYGAAIGFLFVAVEHIDQVIALPITTMCPALVMSFWSVFYFKEIEGRRNLSLLAAAYVITAAGVIAVAVSKVGGDPH